MKDKKKYQKIVDELIEKNFPELKSKKIWIREYNGISYGGTTYVPFVGGILWINIKARKFTNSQRVGLISHELCHFSIFSKRNFVSGMVRGLVYFLSKNHRKFEEMETIKFSIKKGFGRQFYDLSKVSFNDVKRKEMNKSYLSPEEIKKYAKKIGKW